MKKDYRLIFLGGVLAATIASVVYYLTSRDVAILNPEGSVASAQRDLLITATLLMMIVVVPVFVMTFWIAWRYREGNQKAKYTPDWGGNRWAEITWWAIPGIIITILGVMIWRSSHDLDPFKPLASNTKPITIQVVALQWKWLFIYPEQDVATVNYFQFPEDTPVNFEITADAPMNSFWIPELGGQIYAMAGMTTKLHLIADRPGNYEGSSANLSGEGFSNMRFTARASTLSNFNDWVVSAKASSKILDMAEYNKLAEPSLASSVMTYSSTEDGLHSKVVDKYMKPVNEEGGEDRDNQSEPAVHHH